MTSSSSLFLEDSLAAGKDLTPVSSSGADVGRRIRAARGARKAEALAAAAGLDAAQWSRYENGHVPDVSARNLKRIADALGVSASYLMGETLPLDEAYAASVAARVQEQPVAYGSDVSFPIPLPIVAEAVAAGEGTIPLIPIEERPYFFREDFLRRKGWTPQEPDRFVCIKLASVGVAESMYPTIQPESLLLVDRRPSLMDVPERSIWWVEFSHVDQAVKRVTVRGKLAIMESDNPDPEYAPRFHEVPTKEARTKLLKARVLWYATEVA